MQQQHQARRSFGILAVACLLAGVGGGTGCGSNGDAATPKTDAGTKSTVDSGGLPPVTSTKVVLPPPTKGAFMGAYVGAGPDTEPDSQSEELYTNEEVLIGRRWVIDNRFYDDSTDWVNDRTKWDISQHIVPLVTWMPVGDGDPLDEYIAGQHDAYVTQEAQEAKALGPNVQILLRWGHEMNGNWYPWSGSLSGGDDDGGTNTGPAKYIAAWKHVHDIFVQVGATNVVWVWCINVADVPQVDWNHWTNYYPGDDVVDWVGLDAYNWGSSSSCCVWTTFEDLVSAPYQDYVGKKPMMLPETASAEVGGNKAAWIADMQTQLKTVYTGIQGVVWFDINKETDWRIASSQSSLAAYKAMASDPYFNP